MTADTTKCKQNINIIKPSRSKTNFVRSACKVLLIGYIVIFIVILILVQLVD